MYSITFVLLIFSSVLINSHLFFSIHHNCLTDDDCDFEFECQIESQLCSCPSPYFWDEKTSNCIGCPSFWLTYEHRQCFFITFANSSTDLLTWIEAQTICQHQLGQLFTLTNVDEFEFIKDQIEFRIADFSSPFGIWIDFR